MEERTSNPLHHVAATHSAGGGRVSSFYNFKNIFVFKSKVLSFLAFSMFDKPEAGVADVEVALLAEVLDLLGRRHLPWVQRLASPRRLLLLLLLHRHLEN